MPEKPKIGGCIIRQWSSCFIAMDMVIMTMTNLKQFEKASFIGYKDICFQGKTTYRVITGHQRYGFNTWTEENANVLVSEIIQISIDFGPKSEVESPLFPS
jgi:hypothetical protein